MADEVFGDPTPPAKPVRVNRKAVMLASVAGALAIGGMIYYTQFQSAEQRRAAEQDKAPPPPKPQEMAGTFPKDYTGDVTPVVTVTRPAPEPAAAPPASPAPPETAARQVATRQVATPAAPAKPMAPMYVDGRDPAAAAIGEPGRGFGQQGAASLPLGDYRPGTDDGDGNRLPADARQGLATQKAAWLANAGNAGQDVVAAPYRAPLSRFQIQAGVIIHAALLTALNTDLPGDVVALITHDVFDTATGRYLLIPSGAKLYGRYDNQLSYGQTRAAIAWNRILLPNGASQNIGAMVGTDASGTSGVAADVDRHPWSMAAAIAGSAAFTVLGQIGALLGDGDANTNIGVLGAGAAGQETANVGRQIVGKELARPNTLTVPQGYRVAVLVSRDMALPPYAR